MSSIIRADRWQNSNGVAYNSVLQVVSTTKTDTFSTTSTSFTDVTGLSVTITPRFSTSRILIIGNFNVGISGDIALHLRLMRDSTAVFIGDAASNRPRDTNAVIPGNMSANTFSNVPVFLDSPATTSATVYKVQMFVNSGTGYLNRSGADRDTTGFDARTASSITVMEIAQ